MRTQVLFDGLNALQEFLLAMAPGDELSAQRASEISGLELWRCEALLHALMRAGVMMRLQHDVFVRCRLQPAERHFAAGAEAGYANGKAPVLLSGPA